MDFTSDNICGVSEEILAALSLANEAETAAPYGADVMSMSLNELFSNLFDKPAYVFPISTGTAANALSLGALVQPWQAILTHEKAHIEIMECGAPEFLSGGAKLIGVPGEHGKLTVGELEKAVRYSGKGCLHRSQVAAISLTQTTDSGAVYLPEEVCAITQFAKENGLRVHMDGARFANAVAALGCSPADLVQDVDVLSFGATKNGAMNAEAIVFFDEALARDFAYQAKRCGHVISKQRYLSAQLIAYLKNDLWLKNAEQANKAAQYLADCLQDSDGVVLETPVQSNLVFLTVTKELEEALRAGGAGFYSEEGEQPDYSRIRLACGFSTSKTKVNAFVDLLHSCLNTQRLAA